MVGLRLKLWLDLVLEFKANTNTFPVFFLVPPPPRERELQQGSLSFSSLAHGRKLLLLTSTQNGVK